MFCIPHSSPLIEVTLLILGVDNAGKTSLLTNILKEPLSSVAPTIGFSQSIFRYKKFQIRFIDVGGGSNIRGIWSNYFASAHGCIFVIDSSDHAKFAEIGDILSSVMTHKLMYGKPILILANKQDMSNESNIENMQDKLVNRLIQLTINDSCRNDTQNISAIEANDGSEFNTNMSTDKILSSPSNNNNNNNNTVTESLSSEFSDHQESPTSTTSTSTTTTTNNNNNNNNNKISMKDNILMNRCIAVDTSKHMRKIILKSLSWLLFRIRADWLNLDARVTTETRIQNSYIADAKRKTEEQVKTIKAERSNEDPQILESIDENQKENPFKPIIQIIRVYSEDENNNNTNNNNNNNNNETHSLINEEYDQLNISVHSNQFYEKFDFPTKNNKNNNDNRFLNYVQSNKLNSGFLSPLNEYQKIFGLSPEDYYRHSHSAPGLPTCSPLQAIEESLEPIFEGEFNVSMNPKLKFGRNKVGPKTLTTLLPYKLAPPIAYLSSLEKIKRRTILLEEFQEKSPKKQNNDIGMCIETETGLFPVETKTRENLDIDDDLHIEKTISLPGMIDDEI